MKMDCEHYQINISALLDGELKGSELTETVKHLAECDGCKREMEIFERMQSKVDEEFTVQEVPRIAWKNIARIAEADSRKPAVIDFKSSMVRYIAVAASILIVFGLGYFFGQPGNIMSSGNEPLINLTSYESGESNMSEDKFLQLTRNLLNSDPKYQMKMYLVLHTIYGDNIEGGMELVWMEENEGAEEGPTETTDEMRF